MATTRLGLHGPAAAYPGFVAKAATIEPNSVLWNDVAYAQPAVVSAAYSQPTVASMAYAQATVTSVVYIPSSD